MIQNTTAVTINDFKKQTEINQIKRLFSPYKNPQ